MTMKKLSHDLEVSARDRNMHENLARCADRLEAVVRHMRSMIQMDKDGFTTWTALSDLLASQINETNLVLQDAEAVHEFVQAGVELEAEEEE
jgi:hypothetical protein